MAKDSCLARVVAGIVVGGAVDMSFPVSSIGVRSCLIEVTLLSCELGHTMSPILVELCAFAVLVLSLHWMLDKRK
ncbi:hypothetical protein K1719_043976 [Acacia pycnantha]|nr:hypothetical protein K1719_043976 [Acacia pycnantha]